VTALLHVRCKSRPLSPNLCWGVTVRIGTHSVLTWREQPPHPERHKSKEPISSTVSLRPAKRLPGSDQVSRRWPLPSNAELLSLNKAVTFGFAFP
jgi:hypothetical protein